MPSARPQAARQPSGVTRKRRSRGKGLRVRTGCARCKSRHVKCDEARPTCDACRKADQLCEYPNDTGPVSPLCQADSPAADARVPDPRTDTRDTDSSSALNSGRPHEMSGSGLGAGADVHQECVDTAAVWGTEADLEALGEQFYNPALFGTSPESAWSGGVNLSAETAPLKWFGLVATDAGHEEVLALQGPSWKPSATPRAARHELDSDALEGNDIAQDPPGSLVSQTVEYRSADEITLSAKEISLLRHFVVTVSCWIDLTDCERSFAIVVPQIALRNQGVMSAVLAVSARHTSLVMSTYDTDVVQSAQTSALQYYHQTLSYLQNEMQSTPFLTSDELLTTVLLISTYEMMDGAGRGWERHLKGVFGIQRSQLIHGESVGLKQRIWWAWLRQDIWVAFREQRKILSYYSLTRECSDLGFWELVDRAVWLLGQCVNYASLKEQRLGQGDIQGRVDRSTSLWSRLDKWASCFSQYDRRLPAASDETMAFEPIWINPPTAGESRCTYFLADQPANAETVLAVAIQVHHFSRLLLLEHTPATGGLRELITRQAALKVSVKTICGIASTIVDQGATIASIMCLYAAAIHVREGSQRNHAAQLIYTHRERTGWPPYDLVDDLQKQWADHSQT